MAHQGDKAVKIIHFEEAGQRRIRITHFVEAESDVSRETQQRKTRPVAIEHYDSGSALGSLNLGKFQRQPSKKRTVLK